MTQPEIWLRGPLPDVPPLLQPIAHALLQARDEVEDVMRDFPDEKKDERPNGAASVNFHLRHLTGVLDRLLTYARSETLSPAQLAYLEAEGGAGGSTVGEMVGAFSERVERAVEELKRVDERTLTEFRGVGRAPLPSTLIGLLVHVAEHTTRHVGQLLVTARVVRGSAN